MRVSTSLRSDLAVKTVAGSIDEGGDADCCSTAATASELEGVEEKARIEVLTADLSCRARLERFSRGLTPCFVEDMVVGITMKGRDSDGHATCSDIERPALPCPALTF